MKKTKPQKFPNISRFITESKKGVGIVILFFLLFSAIIVSGVQAYNHFQQRQQVLGDRAELLSKVIYWETVVKTYKGYRDGYFQLAVLHYQLGNKGKANMYLQEALKLDPNFEEGRKLEQMLK